MIGRGWLTISLTLVGPAIGSAPARAQPPGPPSIAPGDGQLDGRRIPAYTFAWRSYRVSPAGDRTALAVWYDTVSVVERDGRQSLRRTQAIVREGAPTTVLVNEADRITLLPERTLARVGDQPPFIDLAFAERRVSGRRPLLPHNGQPADLVSVDMTLDLPQPAYDWRWWGLLAVALPLAPEYAARFLAFAAEPTLGSPLVLVTVRVVGEGRVGEVPCWIVELDAGAPWTLWIARDRAVAPVRQIRIEQPDGSVLLWEPLASAADTGGDAPRRPPAYEPAPRGTRVLEQTAGLAIKVLVESSNLGGTEVEVGEITFPPGTGAARRPHTHDRVEILYVVSGRLDHIVNGTSHELDPGMLGIVRPGDAVVHRVLGDAPVTALVIWAPAGELERLAPFFRERPIGVPEGR